MPDNGEVDASVGLPAGGSGALVAVKEIKRADGSTVEREEGVIADARRDYASQTVTGERGRGQAWIRDQAVLDELTSIRGVLEEIRDMMLRSGL